jgi:hypothetical protein
VVCHSPPAALRRIPKPRLACTSPALFFSSFGGSTGGTCRANRRSAASSRVLIDRQTHDGGGFFEQRREPRGSVAPLPR